MTKCVNTEKEDKDKTDSVLGTRALFGNFFGNNRLILQEKNFRAIQLNL